MIDTIKLSYPFCRVLSDKIEAMKSRLVKLSPTGDVIFEKGYVEVLPSHFSGLRINDDGKQFFFEFSLQKWQSHVLYNLENTGLLQDITALNRWIMILRSYLGYNFNRDLFLLNRVDLAVNYKLIGASYLEFFRCTEIHLGKSDKNSRRFGTTIYYGSQWVAKKIYHKLSEYKNIEKAKRRGRGMAELIVDENIIRHEIEFKRAFLERKGLRRIENIGRLRARYIEEEKKNLLSVGRFSRSKFGLSPMEKLVCDLVIEKGYKLALEDFKRYRSKPTWYRVRKQLREKNIYLEGLEASELIMSKESDIYFELEKI